jgi:8-oxo-dGTP diphosphatase
VTGLSYIVNVEGAVLKDGRYLIVARGKGESHAPGVLALPGGKVEDAGTASDVLEDTLQRELIEEVGIEVAAEMAYVHSSAFMADDGDPVIDIVFLCRYKHGTPTALDPDEVAAVEWMSAEEVRTAPNIPAWTRHSIDMADKTRARLHW